MAREQMVSSALFCQYGHDVNGCDIIRKILRMESVFMMNTNKKDIVNYNLQYPHYIILS